MIGLALQLRPTLTASGRVIQDATPTRESLAGIRFELRRVDVVMNFVRWDVAFGVTDAGGAFTIEGLTPGQYEVTCRLRQEQPCPSELRRGVQALVDETLTVSENIADLRLDFGEGRTELAGTVRWKDGLAASDYSVVVFPFEPRGWRIGPSSRVRVVPVREDGGYVVTGLPAGRYLVTPAGIDDHIDPTPQLFEDLAPASREVVLTIGERHSEHFTMN